MSNRKRQVATQDDGPSFGEDQISEFRSAFEFFGAEKDQLKKDDLRSIMGKLSLPVNNDTLNKMVQEADPAGTGVVEFTAWVSLMSRKMKKTDSEDAVRGAFKVFDPRGTGVVDSDELYKLLTTTGDKLSEAEAGEMFAVQGVDKDGGFSYNDFLKEVFGSKAGSQ